MKKIIVITFFLFFFSSNIFTSSLKIQSGDKYIDIPVYLNNDVQYISFNKLARVTGAELLFKPFIRKYLFYYKQNLIQFVEMKNMIYINQKLINISNPPLFDNGNIYLPIDIFNHVKNWFKIDGLETIQKTEIAVSSIDEKKKSKDPKNKKIYNSSKKIKYIIIDPGHGGKDPGALGQKGLQEKSVVLKTSQYLLDILKRRLPGVKIILTREKDEFLSLKKRTQIANRYAKNGDALFISVHANASMKGKSTGFETYYLSRDASDEEARAVAAMENSVIDYEVEKTPKGLIKKIIAKMLDEEYIRESKELAKLIQNGYKTKLKGENRGVKKALFYVLEGATMPAVLTEIGFITNLDEEKKMRRNDYLKSIASAISGGITGFIEQYNRSAGFTK